MQKYLFMVFNNLNYKQKIAIAKVFFQDRILKVSNKEDYMPTEVYMSFNHFIFESKISGCLKIKEIEISNFFDSDKNSIRKAKLLEIRKNLN